MKTYFQNFQYFLYKKKSVQNMLGYWPYATHKKTNFDIYIYIYIYVYLPQLRRKTRYSKYEIGINSDFKINILENKSLSLSFIFF